ncbi:MAG TPA: ATP-binding protein [Anaerolineae bacterium]
MGSMKLPGEPARQPENTGLSRRLAQPADDVCPICKGKGFLVYDVPPGHPDFSRVVPCRCTEARLAQERAQSLRTISNLGQLNRLTFDNFLPTGVGLPRNISFTLEHAYEMSREFARDPRGWLVLIGGYGCGKTHLAAAIANQQLALGNPVMFVVVADLLDYLRGAFAPDSSSSYDERFESIREAPLLILDDLGAHNTTPWAQEKLFQIINHRYNARLATVVTSNLRLEDLDPRITSRLVDPDLSQVYEILAPDFRGAERSGPSGLSTLGLHADQTFETFSARSDLPIDWQENLEAALARARTFAAEPRGWLVYSGKNGCGKTHLAAAIANSQLATGGLAAMFVVVPDLLDHLRATFSPTSTVTLDRVFEQVRSVPLLVLDDLGMQSATPWAKEKLFQLLNHRYVARTATVITTSLVINELEPWLQTRMLDKARCVVFGIEAPSYRGSESQRTALKRGNRESQETPKARAAKPRGPARARP